MQNKSHSNLKEEQTESHRACDPKSILQQTFSSGTSGYEWDAKLTIILHKAVFFFPPGSLSTMHSGH